MKKIYWFVLMMMPLMAVSQERIMVIADPHVFAASLHDDGAAFQEMMTSQRKMIDLGEAAWNALAQKAVAEHADLVLIPGDLTKDGEIESHNLVKNILQDLLAHQVKTLVIPGNHDIGGTAYSYFGEEKNTVQTLRNDQWWEYYEECCSGLVDKDMNSHSYVAEPFEGITVLGIDGSDNSAGTGSLSDQTLAWLLAQADAARAKGNMIIAMSHWQLLEHFDGQASLESACRFAGADAIRDSLMQHGVHLVLTGHFHVNGITTFRDTTGLTHDSIVEITTGSPITYPCPYRWLTLSNDRSFIRVETENMTSLPPYEDYQTYSRDWMRVHTENLIPVVSRQLLGRTDEIFDKLGDKLGALDGVIIPVLKTCMNLLSDEKKIELVQKHLGSTIVNLYLLHSEANEPEHPEAQQLAQDLYAGIENMIHEVTDATMGKYMAEQQAIIIQFAKDMAKPSMQSLVEDVTLWSSLYADRTDDLHLTLVINDSRQSLSVSVESSESGTQKLIRNGQLLIRRGDRMINIMGQQIVH